MKAARKISSLLCLNGILAALQPTLFALLAPAMIFTAQPASATETWEKLDKRLKTQVLQVNVGLKMKVKDSLWVQLSDFSPKYHYPVFSASSQDKGYRVVGFGTAFPVKAHASDKAYFLTNRHVVDSGDQIVKECQRFYAGMRLLAEQTATNHDTEGRFKELLQLINLCVKPNRSTSELTAYQTTADSVWDTYETYLSVKADPGRLLFNRYLATVSVSYELGYFMHRPGPVAQAPLQAKLTKCAKANEPDLAILSVDKLPSGLVPLELDTLEPSEGQEIQVIGYPAASDQLDADSASYYAPTFTSGRISRVTPRTLQVDAPVTHGNSGAPVINQRGKVVGVVAMRAKGDKGVELSNFTGAVTVPSVQSFAPEVFGVGASAQ
jgi:S1-C subfamily serine protease